MLASFQTRPLYWIIYISILGVMSIHSIAVVSSYSSLLLCSYRSFEIFVNSLYLIGVYCLIRGGKESTG